MPLAVLVLVSACSPAEAPPATEVAPPAWEWPASTPEAEGIPQVVVDSIIDDITSGRYGVVDHFLLIRNGKVVAEHHWDVNYDSVAAQYDTTFYQYNYDHPAWHPYYRGTELHTLQSVTKSVNSAGIGIAIDQGLIEGVDVPVLPFFEAYDFDRSDPRKQAMTLEDLLTMRSGIEWNTQGGYSDSEHSTILLENSDQWIQFILNQPMDEDPGTVYEYNDGASVLLGKILREATGQRADRFIDEHLFRPLDIREHYWKISPDGETDTEGGLYLKPRDLAKIGYLFAHGGRWQGEQVVSEDWVERSISPIVERPGYGYQWWVQEQEDGRTNVFAMNGYGGQFMLAARDEDVIAVFNGWNIHDPPEQYTISILQQRILPAIRGQTE
jgi:CubicO group peptidase (beta-lactamase class C family)